MPGTAADFHLRAHSGVIYGLMANPNHPVLPEPLFVSSGKNLKMLSCSGRSLICRDSEHPSAKASQSGSWPQLIPPGPPLRPCWTQQSPQLSQFVLSVNKPKPQQYNFLPGAAKLDF